MARTPISEAELRKAVNTELVALLNTTNLDSVEDLSSTPEVRKSILNFGFPTLARRTIDESDVGGIAREIETALREFEPRLVPGRSRLAATNGVDGRIEGAVSRQRRTEDAADRLPVEFVAEVELDSGKIGSIGSER